jgi:putative transcriptional regulator
MKTMTDEELLARDAQRDIGAELLQAVKDVQAGRWARKTTFTAQPDGSIMRRIERADGVIEKEEHLTGARWELMSARSQSGLSQFEFAKAIGVSKRTLENWEQGRAHPTGAARRLLLLAARFPDTLQRLSGI